MRTTNGPASHKRHKKYLKRAKGFYGGRHRLYRTARETAERAMQMSYVGRKLKKRDFRALWIVRINAAARSYGMSYSRFISGLKKAGVELDRKVLAHLAMDEPDVFKRLVELAKQ